MRRVVIFLTILMIISGCTVFKAKDAVQEYLGSYNRLTSEVEGELDNLIKEERLEDSQAKKYKEIMLKQYKDLEYEIVNETYNGDEAIVTTKITVYDLYGAQKEAENYKNNNREQFLDENNIYDSTKFLDYKLEQMKKATKRVEYTIDFSVEKKQDRWVLKSITTNDLEKIHGIYNYKND